MADHTGALGSFAYFLFVLVLLSVILVFVYNRILESTLVSKESELAKAESKIDVSAVQNFIQLRDRLDASRTLLENQVLFSEFFKVIGTLLPTTVRFSSMHLFQEADGTSKFEGSGVAKSFNALAAASASLSADGRIKEIIFSNFTINPKDDSVAFGVTATLDSKLIHFSP